METAIYFENSNCKGAKYFDFLNYAFAETDYFMLVYVNYFGKGYTKEMKIFLKQLRPYAVKSRTNPSWPGTISTSCPNTKYRIVFYENNENTKEILKEKNSIFDWSSPNSPQDLAFFKNNTCWLYSVGHEEIAAIINPTEKDLDYLELNELASRASLITHKRTVLDNYNEIIDNQGSVSVKTEEAER